MEFFASSDPIFGSALPPFDSRRVTTHSALLFHLLSEMQRNGPRAIFSARTVFDVETFFRAMLADPTDEDDPVDHTYWEEGLHTLSGMMHEASNSRTTVRYSAPLVALYLDAFTQCRYYNNCVSNEVLTQMVLTSYPWWGSESDEGLSGSEIKMSRTRITGKLRDRRNRLLSVDVPIAHPWRRGPLWDEKQNCVA